MLTMDTHIHQNISGTSRAFWMQVLGFHRPPSAPMDPLGPLDPGVKTPLSSSIPNLCPLVRKHFVIEAWWFFLSVVSCTGFCVCLLDICIGFASSCPLATSVKLRIARTPLGEMPLQLVICPCVALLWVIKCFHIL